MTSLGVVKPLGNLILWDRERMNPVLVNIFRLIISINPSTLVYIEELSVAHFKPFTLRGDGNQGMIWVNDTGNRRFWRFVGTGCEIRLF